MKRFWIVATCLTLFCAGGSYGLEYTVTQISQGTTANHHAHINNNSEVVWSASDGSYQQVYYWNGSSVTKIEANSDLGYITYPAINDNSDIVWDSRQGSSYDIILYDASTNTTQTISSSAVHKSNPCFDLNGNIAWYGNIPSYDIFLRKSDGTITQIPDGQHPEMNNGGDLAWWDSSGIYYRDAATQQITQISANGQYCDINNSSDIVWSENGDIVLYDSSTGITVNMTESELASENNRYPNINNNGDIVWITEDELYLYENATGDITKIADNIDWYSQPQINDAGNIVWRGTDDAIYFVTQTTAVPEPLSIVLLATGLYSMFLSKRRPK